MADETDKVNDCFDPGMMKFFRMLVRATEIALIIIIAVQAYKEYSNNTGYKDSPVKGATFRAYLTTLGTLIPFSCLLGIRSDYLDIPHRAFASDLTHTVLWSVATGIIWGQYNKRAKLAREPGSNRNGAEVTDEDVRNGHVKVSRKLVFVETVTCASLAVWMMIIFIQKQRKGRKLAKPDAASQERVDSPVSDVPHYNGPYRPAWPGIKRTQTS